MSASTQRRTATPSKVLIVDDDEHLCSDLAELMDRRGYSAAIAHNGRQALERIAEAGVPCLILLDLSMPVMDGRELRAELLRRPDLASVPVVIVSGMLETAEDLDALEAVDHLRKPIDLRRLYRLLDEHCAA